jgi:hypothetical protein
MAITSAASVTRRVSRTTLVAVVVLTLVSCSVTEPGRGSGGAELTRNRQRWESARLQDYEFDYQLLCFCAVEATEQVHIVVRGDQVSAVTRARDGLPAINEFGRWPTVPDLFDGVEQMIERKADRLEVTYDPTYGYPRSIVVDLDRMAADDESSRYASSLRPLH